MSQKINCDDSSWWQDETGDGRSYVEHQNGCSEATPCDASSPSPLNCGPNCSILLTVNCDTQEPIMENGQYSGTVTHGAGCSESSPCDPNSPNYDPFSCNSGDPCDPWSSSYNPYSCQGDPCDPYSSNYDPYACGSGGDPCDYDPYACGGNNPCDPYSSNYDPYACGGDPGGGDYGGGTNGGEPEPPPTNPSGNKQPTKWKGDANAIARGAEATRIFTKASEKTDFQDVLNHKGDDTESSISITENTPGTVNVAHKSLNQGATSSTTVSTDPNNTIVAGLHTHPPGANEGPSPGDLYHLINSYKANSNYKFDFTAHNNGVYALVVQDPAKFDKFLKNYKQDETIGITPSGSSQWVGDPKDPYSTRGVYEKHIRNVYNAKYPDTKLEEYALAFMLDEMKTGVRLMVQVDGVFKELTVGYSTPVTIFIVE